MDWWRVLAYVTGTVDQELLARNEYLATENRILKAQLKARLKLSDVERAMLGEIGHRLGRKILAEVATVAKPDTILGWYRKLVARKFDGSKGRRGRGSGESKPDARRGTHRKPDAQARAGESCRRFVEKLAERLGGACAMRPAIAQSPQCA